MKQAAVVVLALSLAGCASPDSPGQENAMFPDLPAPQGFVYVRGYGHVQAAFRNYIQTYSGKDRVDNLVDWYKKAFAAHDWSVASETNTGHASITFVKKAEQATVIIETKGDGLEITVRTGKRP